MIDCIIEICLSVIEPFLGLFGKKAIGRIKKTEGSDSGKADRAS